MALTILPNLHHVLGLYRTEVSIVGGVLPCAEWTAESDETDDLHLYANKFDCLGTMLDQLVTAHGCVIRSK